MALIILKVLDILINPLVPKALHIGSKLKYHVGDMFHYIFQTFLVTKCITFWNTELWSEIQRSVNFGD